MEDNIAFIMIAIQGIFWTTMLILLIYLIVRRINLKDQEKFEKRDN